jgi:hypothetical protein
MNRSIFNDEQVFRRGWFVKIALMVLIASVFAAKPVMAGGGYCAIAYSTSTGQWGDSFGYNSRSGAERRALSECHAGDAFIAGWGYNRYVVLAVGSGGAWGCGSAPTKREAEMQALHLCRAPDAHIIRYAYSYE